LRSITIQVGDVELAAELFDSPTARAIYEVLPIDAAFQTWGDEFYFKVSVDQQLDETATTEVRVGDVGYWPPGRAVAVFFGPTPASTGQEPVPASEVNLVGRIRGDATRLREVSAAGRIRMKQAT
jgi:hypothetical protein